MSDETFLMKPKVDFCFKELMEDAEIRRGFISALLGVKPEKIEGTELLPTHLRREHEEDKLGILDIRVFIYDRIKGKVGSFNEKSQMDLEIQLAPFPLWPERSVFYLAKMFTGEIKKGESYDVLQKCIHVGILNFLLFPEDGHAGLIVRRLDIHGQAPFKSGTKAFLQGLNIFGRFIRGYDDLLFGLIQGIKCVEKFLLSTLLADNKLYIVDEQHIVVSVFFPEFGGCDIVLVPDGIDQLIGEFLGGNV